MSDLQMKVEIYQDDGHTIVYEGEQAWNMITQNKRPYNGPSKLKTPPECKKSYRGKNNAGGRKAKFRQPQSYKRGFIDRRHKHSLPNRASGIRSLTPNWYGWEPPNND